MDVQYQYQRILKELLFSQTITGKQYYVRTSECCMGRMEDLPLRAIEIPKPASEHNSSLGYDLTTTDSTTPVETPAKMLNHTIVEASDANSPP